MNDSTDKFEPTPEFLSRLDREVDRAFRSEQLFGPPVAPMRSRRLVALFGIAAGVVLTLVTGIVLGASANDAAAATPTASRSPFALEPVKNAINALACAPARIARAQQTVPVVDLLPASAKTTANFAAMREFGGLLGLKETADGRVLVNDARNRQLHLFEADLSKSTVVLDSAPGSARSYGKSPSPFLSYLGDSALIRDQGNRDGMLVLDGRGEPVRALALLPMGVGIPPALSIAHVDSKGRLLALEGPGRWTGGVRVPASSLIPPPARPGGQPSGMGGNRGGAAGGVPMGLVMITDRPDSLPITRMDLDARRLDTVAYVTHPPFDAGRTSVKYGKNGAPESAKELINPLFTIDDWAMLSDGTIAIVRGHDYHVDWIHPDGTRSASPKLPYDWKKLSDGDKQRLVDSTRTAVDSVDAFARANFGYPGVPEPRTVPYEVAPLSQIADYYPPIRARSALPDRDGNLWILPQTTKFSSKGELVYDVVNPKQGLVRHVRVPLGRSIVGFGRGSVVYLQAGDLKNGFTLERAAVPGVRPPPK